MAYTVGNFTTAYKTWNKNISDIEGDVLLQLLNHVQQHLYRLLYSTQPDLFRTTTTITVSSSPETESLPADFESIQPYGCGFYEHNSDGTVSSRKLTQVQRGSTSKGFQFTGLFTSVIIYGYTASQTFTLDYIPTLAQLTGDSSELFIPVRFEAQLIQEIQQLHSLWAKDENSAAIIASRAAEAANNLLTYFPAAPKVYSIPSNLSAF